MCICILVFCINKAHTHISSCFSYFASGMKTIKSLKTTFFATALRIENQFHPLFCFLWKEKTVIIEKKYTVLDCITVIGSPVIKVLSR